MWLNDYLKTAFGYILSYMRFFRVAGFNYLREALSTRGEIARFYVVTLLICSFAIYYLFSVMDQVYGVQSGNPQVQRCYSKDDFPFLAFFVLAEIVSFFLFIAAKVEMWIANRLSAEPIYIGPKPDVLTDAQAEHASARRLHRITWGWFPIIFLLAIWLSENKLNGLISQCKISGPSMLSFLIAILWPGFLISFAAVVSFSWIVFRWRWNLKVMLILFSTFCVYSGSATLVSPANKRFIDGFRYMPHQLDSIGRALLGIKSEPGS